MRREPSNSYKTSLTRAAFVCAALVLALCLLWAVYAALSPAPEAPAGSTPPAEEKRVAWFGSATDPFSASLSPRLEELCRAKGWRLISYDCRGRADGQVGQIQDFLRTEQADAAVVYSVMDSGDLNRQVMALAEVCPVVTVGQPAGVGTRRLVAAHVGGEEKARAGLLAEYLAKHIEGGTGALLLTEVPDETAEGRYMDALSQENITVLDHNYTWAGQVYAERYLNTALDAVTNVGAVVCTSRYGTAGALQTLGERGLRDKVKIVSFCYDPAMADDLADGNLDAAVAFSPTEAGEKLGEVLPDVLGGKKAENQTLTPVLLTPENVGETELGYE